MAIYAAIAVTVLGTLGPDAVAGSAAPLALTVQEAGWGWAVPVVRIGAAAASLGALLALIAGIGRTGLAMAREGDLPRWLAAVHPRFTVPHRAEVALAVVVCILVLGVDLRGAIGFSSFGVLLYYFVANAAAFSQPARASPLSEGAATGRRRRMPDPRGHGAAAGHRGRRRGAAGGHPVPRPRPPPQPSVPARLNPFQEIPVPEAPTPRCCGRHRTGFP